MVEALPKTVIGGRYELGPALGSGGFGTVFRARDRTSGAEVALKLVLPGLGSEPAAKRLRREGAILRRVTSRHVARVLDLGDDDGGVWLVTELVEGGPLTTATLGRPLLAHEVLRVARALLEGLAAVHASGIVHGDVKPSNVLVPRGERALSGVKLVDFGLARIVARSEVSASIGEAMTRQGTVLGTARYMAPEVLSGGDPTPACDVYGAGLVLFELLDVGPLFAASDARAALRARAFGDPELTSRIPEPLSDVLARMLAREPSARYRDGREAHEAVVDLDTAPVSIVSAEEPLPGSTKTTMPPVHSLPPSSSRSQPPRARTLPPPSRPAAGGGFAPAPSSIPLPPVGQTRVHVPPLAPPPAVVAAADARARPRGSRSLPRLTRLPEHPIA
ncbi:MAG TPA: serine/threonine-protein kinase, partial [Planctomycetota bacterium]|nr:serine/threonine-protein kinase [Planctomycetota bacterium]